MTNAFQIEGYQTPFRKDNTTNNGGGLLVYVKIGIHVKRREDLETNDISCIWLEIIQEKGKSFLIGNLYRPPDSRIEYNDRFEDFVDKVSTMIKSAKQSMYKTKLEEGKDNPSSIWKLFRELGAGKKPKSKTIF